MTKTLAILLGLALIWLTAWSIAGHGFREAGAEKLALTDHVAALATRLERGASIGVEGTIAKGPPVAALYSQKPCLAALTVVSLRSTYRDSQGKNVLATTPIARRRAGPASIEIEVGDQRIALPLELWMPKSFTSEAVEELPARLEVKADEIELARNKAPGSPGRFDVSESLLQGGERFFVVGRLEDRDGQLRLEPDPLLQRVELYPGTRDEMVASLQGSGGGLRTAGWILGFGVGPLPLAIAGLVLLRRRGRAKPA